MANQLREANNQVYVEGLLQEVRLEPRTSHDGKKFIGGEIDIRVSEDSIHTFHVFSYALKKDGSENSIYKGLETVMNEYLSIAKVGEENADKVRVNAGKLGINDYVGQDTVLRSVPQLSTNFINRVQGNDVFEPKAEFEVELVVRALIEEVDKETEEETGRIIVKGIVPLYGGKVAPLEFVAEGEGAEYIRSTYENGHTVTLYGELINSVTITKTKQEVGFGKPKEKVKRNFKRGFLITGGSEPYEEENVSTYKIDDIKAALVERETYLEELKNKKQQQEQQPKKEEKKGFGKPQQSTQTKPKSTMPF